MKNIFIAMLTYKKPLDEVSKYRPEHLDFLDIYYKAGKFIVSGRQTPPTGGVILAHNVTKEELTIILKEDPFYKNGLANFEITEFTPAKYTEKFEVFIK
ncbi:MAG: YciI family protein [Leptotrichiaceae bacterium]|nr:YciI family protein [Leptotrichiaceae bacterium]